MLQLASKSVVDDFDFEVTSLEVLDLLDDLDLLHFEVVRLLKLDALWHDVWEVEHDVVNVDVSVKDVPLVQLVQAICYFTQDGLYFILLQRLFSSGNDVVQGPSVGVLLDEDVLTLILEKFDQCHACIGVCLLEDAHLLLKILPPLLCVCFSQVCFVHHFGGIRSDRSVCGLLAQENEVNSTHASSTQLSHHFIVVTGEDATSVSRTWLFHRFITCN